MRVLIIDDEPAIRSMYKEKMESEGYEVIEAGEGVMGLDQARVGKPDLILLDVIMPKTNGLDVLKEMKSDPEIKGTPVYLLTNIPEESAEKKGQELGAAGYLFKAETEPADLVNMIDKVLKKKK